MGKKINGRFLLYSLLAHACLLGLIGAGGLSYFFKKKIGVKQVVQVELSSSLPPSNKLPQKISKPVKTNLQSVPPKKRSKKPKKQVKKVPPPLSKKKRLKKRKKPVSKSLHEQQNQAIDKIKALDSLQKIKQEMQGAVGKSFPQGEVLEDFELLQYIVAIKSHISRYWYLPTELADKNLKMKLLVVINPKGQILRRQIMRSSGNEEFDARVLETVETAVPLPSPVSQKVQQAIADGIIFNFPE